MVNGLTPAHHPCQALADLLTLRERFGDLARPAARLRRRRQQRAPARWRSSGELAGVEVVVAAPAGYQLEDGARREADRRPARRGRRRRRDLHRRLGEHGRRGRRGPPPRATSPRSRSTTTSSPPPPTARSSSTACPPTPARRSPRRSSTATAPPSGTRPRTACTPRRRCSSCCWRTESGRPARVQAVALAVTGSASRASAAPRSRRTPGSRRRCAGRAGCRTDR